MEATMLEQIDPITFEVLRHRLWMINDEAAATLLRVSGSPVATEIHDCNTALLDANGDACVVGIYFLSIVLGQEIMVKYILREYADNPGIGPDDMFICSDPYVGAPHQNDVTLLAPIHVGDELIAWAGVGVHQVDVGGPTKGSQVSLDAESIYEEAIPMPPIKLIEGGRLRKDLEAEYLIRSRTRELNALDLRAKIASNNVAKARIHALVERYGLETVKAALRGTLDHAEVRFRGRLRELPDGTWRHTSYIDHATPTLNAVYPVRVAVTKRDDTLTVDFRGTAAQAPAVVNCTYAGLVSGVLGSILPYLCWDIPWAPAGIRRAVEIISEPGTVTDATWPAGTCKATTAGTPIANTAVNVCLGKLLAASETYHERAMAPWMAAAGAVEVYGLDQRGQPFGATLLDQMAGGAGARGGRDGVDTGSISRSLSLAIANVETYEFRYPLLYLYRRQEADTGGPGRYRGGVSVGMMYTPHDVDVIPTYIMHVTGCHQPNTVGLDGGYPASTNQMTLARGSRVRELLAQGIVPQELAAVGGTVEPQPGISETALRQGDIYHCVMSGGGGYLDPLEREPAAVGRDVAVGLVSAPCAADQYGVVVNAAGAVDAAATAARRTALRADRLARGQRPAATANGLAANGSAVANGHAADTERVQRVNEVLAIARRGDALVVQCRCGQALGPATENFKLGAVLAELPLQAAGPHVNPAGHSPGRFVFRHYYCPACATLLATEVALAGSPPEWDVQLAVPALARR
jgi:N-methylhydantoinase B